VVLALVLPAAALAADSTKTFSVVAVSYSDTTVGKVDTFKERLYRHGRGTGTYAGAHRTIALRGLPHGRNLLTLSLY
jgi:hypothetical protein